MFLVGTPWKPLASLCFEGVYSQKIGKDKVSMEY